MAASYKLISSAGDGAAEPGTDRARESAFLLGAEEYAADVEAGLPAAKVAPGDRSPGGGAAAAAAAASCPERERRLVSLDVFRGVTVLLMILVDDAGSFFPGISHSPWDGVTLADLVMPFFLFIVGVSLALAYKRVGDKRLATRKAILRTIKLFVIGLILQCGYFHGIRDLTYGVDLSTIRIMGILQRIAIAYIFAAICEIWLTKDGNVDSVSSLLAKYRYQLAMCLILTVMYLTILYGVYVPDWQYEITTSDKIHKSFTVKCSVRGNMSPGCNVVGMIDRTILGIEHVYKYPVYQRTKQCSINSPLNGPLPSDAPPWCQAPFDPEGLLSSVMATVTCLIGLQFGHIIIHFKHKDRMMKWAVPSSILLSVGLALDFFGMRMNKPLYTVSYTCATAGAAGLFFTGNYLLVDVLGFRRLTTVMEWMGKHALMIFVLIACNIVPLFIMGFYWKEPRNNLLRAIGVGG